MPPKPKSTTLLAAVTTAAKPAAAARTPLALAAGSVLGAGPNAAEQYNTTSSEPSVTVEDGEDSDHEPSLTSGPTTEEDDAPSRGSFSPVHEHKEEVQASETQVDMLSMMRALNDQMHALKMEARQLRQANNIAVAPSGVSSSGPAASATAPPVARPQTRTTRPTTQRRTAPVPTATPFTGVAHTMSGASVNVPQPQQGPASVYTPEQVAQLVQQVNALTQQNSSLRTARKACLCKNGRCCSMNCGCKSRGDGSCNASCGCQANGGCYNKYSFDATGEEEPQGVYF